MGDTTSLVPGFPIRTSSDHSSVDSSPRHNAASHVLHRLPVPRHPPCALTHLQHKKPIRKKKLHIKHTQQTTTPQRAAAHCVLDARNHYPQIKHHTPPPKMEQQHASHPTLGPGKNGPVVSGPNSVSGNPHDRHPRRIERLLCTKPCPLQTQVPHGSRLTQCQPLSWCSLERR